MISRNNNFDIIRLAAAIQVLLIHGIEHLKIKSLIFLKEYLTFFPGVLIFFTLSGFLIYSSLDRNKNLKKYFINRFLRLFPALWICFFLTFGLLCFFEVLTFQNIISWTFIKWVFTQITFFQFWTPDILRLWGVGTPNGSLWTIPVEMQFYILLPFIVLKFNKIKLINKFIFCFLFSFLFNVYISYQKSLNETILVKLLGVSILPYLFSFLIGCIIYEYWNKIQFYFKGRALYWLFLFVLFNFIFNTKPSYYPNFSQLISNLLLSIFVISLAFTFPRLEKVLKGNDVSYGIYIYHMLVINTFISINYIKKIEYLILSITLTVILSLLSWFLIEKRAMQFKKNHK